MFRQIIEKDIEYNLQHLPQIIFEVTEPATSVANIVHTLTYM